MTTIAHLTLATGHMRASPRSEVGDDAIRALAPLMRGGRHPVPGFPDHEAKVTTHEGALMATVFRGEIPLVTFAVATDAASLASIVRLLEVTERLTIPACVVQLLPTAHLDPDAMHWLGDFERCLAWAWVERRRAAS